MAHFGNTPGHVNHWTKRGFLRLLSSCGFQTDIVKSPLPWTMVLGTFVLQDKSTELPWKTYGLKKPFKECLSYRR